MEYQNMEIEDGTGRIPADEMIEWMLKRKKWPQVLDTDSYFTKLKKLRIYYELNLEEILEFHKTRPNQYWQTYPLDWRRVLTPIELDAWNAIRTFGHIVLYPQFPVGKYHLDFAAPHKKIGVELDGKQFHDKERDNLRDQELKGMGWTIYRITGREMHRVYDPFAIEFGSTNRALDAVKDYLFNYGEGILYAIRVVHFGEPTYLPMMSEGAYDEDSIGSMLDSIEAMCAETLAAHTSFQ